MKHLTPLRAIRQHCLVCGSRPKDVRECPSTDCILYQYRMGHNNARKGIGPKKVYARSISDSVLPNSTRFSERFFNDNRVKEDLAMPKEIVQPGANGKEILPIMEAVGKIQMLGKKIIIEW